MVNLKFEENLKLHLKAGVRAIYIESSEWERLHHIIENCSEKDVWFWSSADGFCLHNGSSISTIGKNKNPKDFVEMLEYIRKDEEREDKVYVIKFADFYLSNREVAMRFALTLQDLQENLLESCHIIVLAPTLDIPSFLKKEFSVLDLPLPEREEIEALLLSVKEEFKLDSVDDHPRILDSVRGLGTTEIRNAFAKVAAYHGSIDVSQINDLTAEKEQIIRKTGYLNFIRTDLNMDFIGGLGNLREWLKQRKKSFGAKARKAKLNPPKGVLLTGIPGTGKSLCAKAAAAEWEMPLLRLDMGSIYSSGVGDSESNMRNAIKVAESLAPCVLWIDEIEKGLSGGASQSGELDGGTSMRVFGSLLTWMQEKEKEVFVFATANKIEKLPPEFLRKGRFDEIFFIDLPGTEARKNIFRSHLNKKGQKNVSISDEILCKTNGFSGAEIESVVNEALFMSFNEDSGAAKITEANLITAADMTVPLSSTMSEYIEDLRKVAEDRFRMAADKKDAPEISNQGDGLLRLPSEKINRFAKRDKS